MNDKEKAALRKAIDPIATEIRNNFLEAMVLRVDVHIELALSNGAEDEDIPEVIANAIETAVGITTEWFAKLGELDKANAFAKGKGI